MRAFRSIIAVSVLMIIGSIVGVACGDPYEEGDNNVAPPAPPDAAATACGALDCGAHGRCEGADACKCETAYAGPTCRECAPGLTASPDGTCRGAPCGNTECKAHEICEAGTTCKCAVGYVNEGGACVWRGGPLDPAFQNTPLAWVLSGNTVIIPTDTDTGFVDPGAAHIFDGSSVTQSFDMPDVEIAEPLAMDLSFGCPRCGGGLLRKPELVFTIEAKKGFVAPIPTGMLGGGKMVSIRTCLGDRSFGGKKTITLRARDIAPAPIAEGGAFVDRLAIVPDPTCPKPGVVPNGDFDGVGGWTGSGANAEVANAVGTNGTRGARLVAKCSDAAAPTISGAVSVPSTAIKHPALTFTWRLTSAQVGSVLLGGLPFGFLRGTGAFEQAKFCFPEWTKGNAYRLGFHARQNTSCSPLPTNVPDSEMLVDDVKLVEDATCPDTPAMFDPGFELGTATTNRWSLGFASGGSASIVKNNQAHSGEQHLSMSVASCASFASVAQVGTVPDAAGNAGPAAKFWYRATIMQDSSATGIGTALASAVAWTQKTVCISPIKSGLPILLDFSVVSPAATDCATGSFVNVDDVELTTDPNCPAQ